MKEKNENWLTFGLYSLGALVLTAIGVIFVFKVVDYVVDTRAKVIRLEQKVDKRNKIKWFIENF